VARFVGVDRGLKRLSLTRVADIELQQPVTATRATTRQQARRATATHPFPYLLLVDHDDRPVGWIHDREIPLVAR
jgi:osmoprotectant transport system ATP-binding protein